MKILKKLLKPASFFLACIMISGSVFAAEAPVRVLKYDESVKLAIDNNSSLEALSENVDLAESSRKLIMQSIGLSLPSSGTFVASGTTLAYLISAARLESQIETAGYQKTVLEAAATVSVKTLFSSIKTAEKSYEMASKNYNISRDEYLITDLKCTLGMVSESEKISAYSSLSKQKSDLESLKNSIDTAYLSLKKLLGINSSDAVKIEYDVAYSLYDMKEENLDSYITRMLGEDPSLKAVYANVKLAEKSLMTFTNDGDTSSFDERKNTLSSASREYADTKKDLEQGIRTNFLNIKTNEAEHKTLEEKLKSAKLSYSVAKTSYDLGMITKLAFSKAELAVSSAELDLMNNELSHDTLVFNMTHPYCIKS